MSIIEIKAIGNLLMYYHSDLVYIDNFNKFKQSKLTGEEYSLKSEGSFYSYLGEYKIARQFTKGETINLLKKVKFWVDSQDVLAVDDFASYLNKEGVTSKNNLHPLSAGSKILFLNTPEKILPLDKFGKTALDVKANDYREYSYRLNEFKEKNLNSLKRILSIYKDPLEKIENEFKHLERIESIRISRLTDKLLWTIGKHGKTVKELY